MSEASRQFGDELARLINRASQESDITVGEMISVLEIAKYREITRLFKTSESKEDGK